MTGFAPQRDASGVDTWPPVSVVIPARNEAGSIAEAVRAALAQDYRGELEVVVADGMSTDGTRAILAGMSSRDGRVRVVDNPESITPTGLNAAISASRGEVIVRCDGHALLPPTYVRRAVELLVETGADNVGGVQAATGRGPVQRAIAMAMSTPLGVGDARFHYGGRPGAVDTVYLGVFRRDTLDRVGLFDPTLIRNQDYELNHRIRASGGSVYFHPDLRVAYLPRSSFGALWRQYAQYGAWKRVVLRRHPRSLRWRQLAAPALVAGLGLSALAAVAGRGRLGAILPGVYAAALTAEAARQTIASRDPAALLLPVAVGTMHLAWGTGFLAGRADQPTRPA